MLLVLRLTEVLLISTPKPFLCKNKKNINIFVEQRALSGPMLHVSESSVFQVPFSLLNADFCLRIWLSMRIWSLGTGSCMCVVQLSKL